MQKLFLEFACGILQSTGPNPRNGSKSDQAHPPIHPIKYANNLQVFYIYFIKYHIIGNIMF